MTYEKLNPLKAVQANHIPVKIIKKNKHFSLLHTSSFS